MDRDQRNPNETLLREFAEWAEPRDDIRSLVVFGSYGYRDRGFFDTWSDIDLALFSTSPQRYYDDPSWLSDVHAVELVVPTAMMSDEDKHVLAVQFADHMSADLGIIHPSALLDFVKPDHTKAAISRGYHIEFDKDNAIREAFGAVASEYHGDAHPMDSKAVAESLDNLCLGSMHSARRLGRGDSHGVRLEIHGRISRRIAPMMIAYALMKHGPIRVPCLLLKNYRHWADELLLDGLQELFPALTPQGPWDSIDRCLCYAAKVARAIGAIGGFAVDLTHVENARAEVAHLRSRWSG
jgi:predicted nucleotidyltransferase